MSLFLAFLAPALAIMQVGPFAAPGQQPVSPLPPEIVERKRQERTNVPPALPAALPKPPSELERCLLLVEEGALQAVEIAQAWQRQAKGVPASQAGHCLGVAYARLERWDEAEAAFLGAREMAADALERARLGSGAGNAALARGDAAVALAVLDKAHADALAAGDRPLTGDIAIDRARALVALDRNDAAAASLAEARAAVPRNAQAWLFSATLSRRMDKLAEAQGQIERAAELMPVDPNIGLEAGVIAVLSGHDAAARKTWESVIAAAPNSDAARAAKGYLAQLADPPTKAPAQP